VRKCDRNSSADAQVCEEGGGIDARADSSAAHGEDHGDAGCPSAAYALNHTV